MSVRTGGMNGTRTYCVSSLDIRSMAMGNPEFNAFPILTFIHLRAYTHVHMQNMHIHTHAHAHRELTQRTTHQVLQEEADAIAAIRAAAVITPPAALRYAQVSKEACLSGKRDPTHDKKRGL